MGNLFSVNEPPPKKDSFGLVLFYFWLFYIGIKIINNIFNNGLKNKNKEEDEKELSNVIGLESVKEEIMYYMDFINNKKKYDSWNVKLPRVYF